MLYSHSSFLQLLRLHVSDCVLLLNCRGGGKEKGRRGKKNGFGGRWRMNFFFSSRFHIQRSFPTWWLMTHTHSKEKNIHAEFDDEICVRFFLYTGVVVMFTQWFISKKTPSLSLRELRVLSYDSIWFVNVISRTCLVQHWKQHFDDPYWS